MVSLGADNTYRDNLLGRSTDTTAIQQSTHSDTSHLMQETDDVAFWDMSSHMGGHFASSIVLTAGEDEEIRKFHPIGSVPVIIGLLLFIALNAIFAFILPDICPDKCGGTTALSLIIYLQIALFFIIFTADILLRRMHFQSRSWGYLEFYRRTRVYRKFPLSATSVGLAVLLFLVILTEELCPDQLHCVKNLSRANTIQIITSVEAVVISAVLLKYLHVCYRFNKGRSTPDVLIEDLSTERILQTSVNHGNQVGFKDGNFKEDLLEKQADEILFLKRRNSYLSSRILHLTSQLNSVPEQSLA
ncbi:putative Transmembrane protein 192 [Hypsibius exemplaris]|uniref:Transmembrane protein 192 n=1 Tax=Hypsibius exemplaris TaxID=2072580 RepID=A0A1W0WK53_HYPEX|nr:putative Transmembrane protein 192 [Hypsibius exemplaris]